MGKDAAKDDVGRTGREAKRGRVGRGWSRIWAAESRAGLDQRGRKMEVRQDMWRGRP